MKPSRKLDALIAEKIMGYKVRWIEDGTIQKRLTPEIYSPPHGITTQFTYWLECPFYSTDIAAAFNIVDKMKDNDNKSNSWGFSWNFELCYMEQDHGPGQEWSAILHGPNTYQEGLATTPAMAICLAALSAMEIKLEDSE